jgi:hypothetical protein
MLFIISSFHYYLYNLLKHLHTYYFRPYIYPSRISRLAPRKKAPVQSLEVGERGNRDFVSKASVR